MLPHASLADIPSDVRALILSRLDDIARDERVRIVLAVESGSRAWGFASADSDYDVRFLYVRRLEDYAALTVPRDVIERPIDGALDFSGWDLRKALTLGLRWNPALVEWLTSYRPHCGAVEILEAVGWRNFGWGAERRRLIPPPENFFEIFDRPAVGAVFVVS